MYALPCYGHISNISRLQSVKAYPPLMLLELHVVQFLETILYMVHNHREDDSHNEAISIVVKSLRQLIRSCIIFYAHLPQAKCATLSTLHVCIRPQGFR